MKVTLYMAISTDGYIAKRDGVSDWVSEVDSEIFQAKISEKGCVVVGRKTYDQYYGDLYPIRDVTNIVLTTDPTRKENQENVIFTNTPKEALRLASEKGYSEVLLVGGGITNAAFLRENLIDEIFLSVHPLILGEGIKIFENYECEVKLTLLEAKQLKEGLVQLHYRVEK